MLADVPRCRHVSARALTTLRRLSLSAFNYDLVSVFFGARVPTLPGASIRNGCGASLRPSCSAAFWPELRGSRFSSLRTVKCAGDTAADRSALTSSPSNALRQTVDHVVPVSPHQRHPRPLALIEKINAQNLLQDAKFRSTVPPERILDVPPLAAASVRRVLVRAVHARRRLTNVRALEIVSNPGVDQQLHASLYSQQLQADRVSA